MCVCIVVVCLLWVLDCDVLLVIFFFKQKTAYEMRISDWSSDVCSSDLHSLVVGQPALVAHFREAIRRLLTRDGGVGPIHSFAQRAQGRRGVSRMMQIGRESCRERV